MQVYTLVIVDADEATTAQREAHRLLAIATLRHGADYWSVQPLEPRLTESGLGFARNTGVIPLTQLPRPIPSRMDPAAIVTPNGYWHWRPLPDDPRFEGWKIRRERLIGHKPGRAVVTAAVHF